MEFRVLGPLEVVDGGRALDLGGPKQRALLALLVLDANRPVSRDRLIDALWEDEPTATAAKALQVYVSRLRKTLGRDRVETAPGGYVLRAEPDEIDSDRCRRLLELGKAHEALALWRGEPLGELAQLRFVRPDIAELEELYLACLEARIQADVDEGRNVAGELEALVAQHPLRERLRELLLIALYRAGRQADALAAYQDARAALVEGLGIEPVRRLRDLHQAILRQDPSLDLPRVTTSRPKFVGRDAELAQLVDGLDDAIAGRGRLFLLIGEPGIGKSRLADELIQIARARRVEVLVGRSWEAGGAPAYWPWVQSLRAYADEAPPELATLLRGEPGDSGSESARFRLFDATADFLQHVSQERPLALFLDDMHAADEPSLLLLQFVARELAHMRVLVVGACRDVDPVPGRALASTLAEVAREPVTTRLSLRGLSEQEVAAYVESELASPELAATLYENTEGNPLFLSETVRLLAVEGRIAIPPSLHDVIARRLAHLSEECNRVLVLAAVLGREFDHDALASFGGLERGELLDRLDEAMTARVVSEVPGAQGRSRFVHVLIRDVLYETLTPARRARLHRAALEVVEDDAERAFHAVVGEDFVAARDAARRAGDRALALLAYEEATRLYDVALAARPDDATRCRLLLARGEAESRAGSLATARDTFLAAASIARELGLKRELAQAALGYGGRIVWRRASADERLVPLLEEALEALGGSPLEERARLMARLGGRVAWKGYPDDRLVPLLEEALAGLDEQELELRARLLARLSGALRDEYSRERRDELSRRAVEAARESGSPAAIAYALDGRSYAILAPDTIVDCLELGAELRDAAAVAGDKERVAAAHLLRDLAFLVLCDVEAAEAERSAAAALIAELRQPTQLSQAQGADVMLALARGRFNEAEPWIEASTPPAGFFLGEAADPVVQCQRHMLRDFRDRLDEIEPEIAGLVAKFPARPVFRCVLAQVHARIGETELAQRALDELIGGDVSALPFDQEWLYGMSLLAETAALLADARAADVLYRALAPWAHMNAVDMAEGCRGSVQRYLGLLAATLGRPEQAAAHLEHAIEINERMGFAPWVERTRADLERVVGAAPA